MTKRSRYLKKKKKKCALCESALNVLFLCPSFSCFICLLLLLLFTYDLVCINAVTVIATSA